MANRYEYTQSGHDAMVGLGTVGLAVVGGLVLVAFIVAMVIYGSDQAKESIVAGTNAVTKDEMRDSVLSRMNSVTLEDLEKKPVSGESHPQNGKDTPLMTGTTYGNGAGMVDVVIYDKQYNTSIRVFGQAQEDGTIRWYDAEYVLDENGKPVVVPRD